MSDLSEDECSLCGQMVAGVYSGVDYQTVYVMLEDPNEEGESEWCICKTCIAKINEAMRKWDEKAAEGAARRK